jgi:hypothetical protein
LVLLIHRPPRGQGGGQLTSQKTNPCIPHKDSPSSAWVKVTESPGFPYTRYAWSGLPGIPCEYLSAFRNSALHFSV